MATLEACLRRDGLDTTVCTNRNKVKRFQPPFKGVHCVALDCTYEMWQTQLCGASLPLKCWRFESTVDRTTCDGKRQVWWKERASQQRAARFGSLRRCSQLRRRALAKSTELLQPRLLFSVINSSTVRLQERRPWCAGILHLESDQDTHFFYFLGGCVEEWKFSHHRWWRKAATPEVLTLSWLWIQLQSGVKSAALCHLHAPAHRLGGISDTVWWSNKNFVCF